MKLAAKISAGAKCTIFVLGAKNCLLELRRQGEKIMDFWENAIIYRHKVFNAEFYRFFQNK